ncbi:MAG: hypothetical protein DBX55_07105 [Verrucomicrobia bacterium]|nr:MAG: hypothetical protein DBX55_07105 [Verrucomicrobiota bacterium]
MKSNLTYTMAFWLIRLWLAARAIGTGLTKFWGTEKVLSPERLQELKDAGDFTDAAIKSITNLEGRDVQILSFDYYHGLPDSGPMSMEAFTSNPLMPSFMVGPYASALGFALIGLGLALLLGICSRVTLFLMGLLYVSLTWGFIILEPTMGSASAAGIAYMGVHLILIIGGLMLADYNKFELLGCKRFGFCKCCGEK